MSDDEFSLMDASRSDQAYVYEVIEAVIAAGANDQYSRYGGLCRTAEVQRVDQGIF